jgi:hypothetical protein
MRNIKIYFIALTSMLVSFAIQVSGQNNSSVSGVFPNLAMVANHNPRTEAGTGGLMPWANRLWINTYVAHLSTSGSGTGLYEINEKMELKKRAESIVGTYAK